VTLSQTGGLVSSANTGNFVTTGQTGALTNVFYPLTNNPAGYITVSSNVGVRMIVPTGTINSGQISGNVVITGAGNVSTYTGLSGLVIISGDTGAYANFVSLSQTGGLVSSANTGNFVTTGQTGLLTNVFYPLNSNPNNYLTSATVGGVRMIVPTGTVNSGQISGNVVITGAGNVSTYTGLSGIIIISGDTGAYGVFALKSDTGQFITSAQTGNFVTTGQTGALTNVFYPLNNNPAGYITASSNIGVRMVVPTGTVNSGQISGNVVITGAGNVSTYTGLSGIIIISGDTGAYANFVTPSQTGQFVTTAQTGGFLTLGNVGGVRTITTTGTYPSGIVSGNVIVSGISTIGVTTGAAGQIVISGNTGAYANFVTLSQTGNVVNTSQTGGFASIQVTGSSLLPLVNLTGAGDVTVVTGATPLVIVSGNTGAYANFITPSQTGLLTGQFYPLNSNPAGYLTTSSAGVTSIVATGTTNSGVLTGVVKISGAGNVSVFTGISGAIIVSGNTGALTGAFYPLYQNPSGYVMGTTGTGILDGQLLIGSSGINGFQQGDLGGVSGIFIVSGSGSLLVGIDSTIVRTSQTGGFGGSSGSSVQITGTTVSNPNFTGVGTVTVTTGAGGLVYVSGRDLTSSAWENKLWIPAAAMTPSQTTGATTGQIFTAGSGHTIDTLEFASGSGQSAYFNISLPKVWNKSIVTPVFYWTTTGNVGTINWGIAAANIDDGTRLDIQYNQGATITDSTISGNYLHQTTGAPLTISGSLSDDDQCYFKVYRSAGGSLASTGKLIGLGLAYTETGLGVGGVTSLNGLTGALNLTGAGTVTVTNSTNTITISGSSVAGQGTAGVNTIGATGITNTGYFTGDVLFSGAGNIVASTGNNNSKLIVISGDTGAYTNFITPSQTGQFVTTAQTGGFLTLGNVGGVRTLQTTGIYPSGFASGNVVISGISIIGVTTGAAGQIVISGNTGAYANFVTLSQTGNVVNTSQTGGFASIQVTGSTLLPLVNLTGAGNVTVFTGANPLVVVSGNTGAYSSFVTLSQTGGFLTSTSLNPYMLITGDRDNTFSPLNIPFTVVKTGLVFINTGSFRIYTVPTNLFLAPDSFELITKNVSGITTGAAFGVGSGTGFTSEFVSGYRMENTGTWGRGNWDMYTDILTGGQNINFNIYTGTTGAANTIHSGYFILRGTLYSGI